MKKLYFLLLLFISCSVLAQPRIKIYAYSQVVMPGTIPVDENGRPLRPKELPVNYYIFAVNKSFVKINFTEVWIKGKCYKTQTSPVDSTPVITTNYDIPDNPVKTILVPATKLRVISISHSEACGNIKKSSSWLLNMTKHAELIVSYFYQGKKYYIPVKKIKVLQTVAGV